MIKISSYLLHEIYIILHILFRKYVFIKHYFCCVFPLSIMLLYLQSSGMKKDWKKSKVSVSKLFRKMTDDSMYRESDSTLSNYIDIEIKFHTITVWLQKLYFHKQSTTVCTIMYSEYLDKITYKHEVVYSKNLHFGYSYS